MDYALLRSVPGVGAITAITIRLECGDLSDFRSTEAFCAFVGLVPDTDISDEHKGKCGITRRRHKTLRYMLTECAWRAIAVNEPLSTIRHLQTAYASDKSHRENCEQIGKKN